MSCAVFEPGAAHISGNVGRHNNNSFAALVIYLPSVTRDFTVRINARINAALTENLMVRLHVQHQRRNHGNRLLPTDAARIRFGNQKVVQLVVLLRAADVLARQLQLPAHLVRIPRQAEWLLNGCILFGRVRVEQLVLDQVLQPLSLGLVAGYAECGRQWVAQHGQEVLELRLGADVCMLVVAIEGIVVSDQLGVWLVATVWPLRRLLALSGVLTLFEAHFIEANSRLIHNAHHRLA